jgi:hypothetical protein
LSKPSCAGASLVLHDVVGDAPNDLRTGPVEFVVGQRVVTTRLLEAMTVVMPGEATSVEAM